MLKELTSKYQSHDANTIDLTALVKELQLSSGEIYSIKFARIIKPDDSYKKLEISTVTMNDRTVNIYGQSFMLILPDRADENFAIQTDIDVLEKNFSPKKYALMVDDKPLFKAVAEPVTEGMISLSVNTHKIDEVLPENHLSAKEISIIPGTEYMLTLSKPDPTKPENIEVIVPLTRGVKYNLSSSMKDNSEFRKTLAELLIGREGLELTNEEIIDISVLSKEIEVQPGEELSFTLLPVKQPGKKTTATEEKKSSLMLDGKVLEITRNEKYVINIPFSLNQTVNFQTDLDYMQKNFEPDAYIMRLDTTSFTSEIAVDTSGYGKLKSTGWLVSMSVNTNSAEEVEKQNQFIAREVSIIPGKDYILTVSKVDGETGEVIEIIVPLTKHVKYDFTANPGSEEAYKESLNKFLEGREGITAIDGAVIDIRLISKELQIKEGDEISFSLLPVKVFTKQPVQEPGAISNLYLDNKLMEFTQIQKFTINVPLSDERKVNMQTDLEHLQENFEPGSFSVDLDTLSFFSELTVDTVGYIGHISNQEEQIKDPVFDLITVNFDLNEYLLEPEAEKIIRKNVVDVLKSDNRLYVTIKGYTDALGDADYNLKLSKKRAESVKEYLKSNGIGDNRIRTFSFGASQLLEKNINWKELDESELRKYRKVEIVIYLPK
jgi:OOP family OmpA-OmpF porin